MDPTTLAFYVVLGTFSIVGLREFRKLFTDNAKLKSLEVKNRDRSKRWEGLFDNLPMAIEQTQEMLLELKSKGVTDPVQLEPVERRLKQLHQVAANQWWIEIALKVLGPYSDKIVKWFI